MVPVPVLQAVPRDSERVPFSRVVWPGFGFNLTFMHSIFEVPVRETFTVDWQGRMVLREIWSTDERIIGYYDIENAPTRVQNGDVRIFDLNLPHEALAIRGTNIGGRAYEDGTCRFRLANLGGNWGALELTVRLRPLAYQIMKGGVAPCPA